MRISISIFKYRIYCKFAFVVIVLAFKQNRLKLKGSSNYVAPVNSRPARRGRVKPSNLKTKNEKIRQPKALAKKTLLPLRWLKVAILNWPIFLEESANFF